MMMMMIKEGRESHIWNSMENKRRESIALFQKEKKKRKRSEGKTKKRSPSTDCLRTREDRGSTPNRNLLDL